MAGGVTKGGIKIKIKIKTLFIVEYRYIKTLARCAIVRHDII